MLCDLVLVLLGPHLVRCLGAECEPLAAYALFIVAEAFDFLAVTFRPYPDDMTERSITRQTRYELVPIRKMQLLLLGRQYVILLRNGYRYKFFIKIKVVILLVSSRN